MRPYIRGELCERCGDCLEICPYEVFAWEGENIAVKVPEDCIECTACVDQCPKKAILMDD